MLWKCYNPKVDIQYFSTKSQYITVGQHTRVNLHILVLFLCPKLIN